MEWTNTSPIISELTDMIKKKWTRFGSQKTKPPRGVVLSQIQVDIAKTKRHLT